MSQELKIAIKPKGIRHIRLDGPNPYTYLHLPHNSDITRLIMSSTKELRIAIEHTTRQFLGAYKDCGEANDPSIINRDVTEDCERHFLPTGVMALVGAPTVVKLNNAAYEAAVAQDMTKSVVTGTRISNLVIDTEACKAAATTVTDVKFHDGEVVAMEHSWVLDFNDDGSKVRKVVEFCDMDGVRRMVEKS